MTTLLNKCLQASNEVLYDLNLLRNWNLRFKGQLHSLVV